MDLLEVLQDKFGALRQSTGEGYKWFLRAVLNQGYIEHVQAQKQKSEDNLNRDIDSLGHRVGRLATTGSRIPADASDEWFLFRDQMFEVERGQLTLEEDLVSSDAMSDNS